MPDRVHFPYGRFAFIMATGIVSIAAGLLGLAAIADALFVLNLILFPVFLGLLALHLRRDIGALAADLGDHRRAPGVLTVIAATCVVANQIALMTRLEAVVAALWIAASILWLGLVYGLFVMLTTRLAKPGLDGIDGSWLLVIVATEALAILTSRAAGALWPPAPVAFVSLCLFLLGGALYLILLILIVQRWLFLPLQPEQLTAPYWINMGAAAIAALAGTRVLALVEAAPALAPVGDFVFSTTILFWALASWWIPLLAMLTVWRHRGGAVRLVYRIDNWSIVFPLGMYTIATWRVAHELGLPFLAAIPLVFVWIALAAWCLTFAGMLRDALGSLAREG